MQTLVSCCHPGKRECINKPKSFNSGDKFHLHEHNQVPLNLQITSAKIILRCLQ